MKRVIDISLGITPEMLVFPTNPGVSVEPVKRLSEGGSSNISEIRLGSHTGTHVDPPAHFIDDGKTVDQLALDVLIGDAAVVDLSGVDDLIRADDLERSDIEPGITRILMRTKNSRYWSAGVTAFPERYVALAPDGAQWMVERGIRLAGIDFLSIEARGDERKTVHTTLLAAGVVIVEGLDLSEVSPGRYQLVCLPLKVMGGDGAPARAVLIST